MVKEIEIKALGVMTMPRYGANASRNIIEEAFRVNGITLVTSTGVFWEQQMQRMFQMAVEQQVDILVAVDSDTCCSPQHVQQLIWSMVGNSDIDCVAALQVRQHGNEPLFKFDEPVAQVEVEKDPFPVDSAHFGLTAIRVEKLVKLKKPWFHGMPDSGGEWSDEKVDPDIMFWKKWRAAGRSVHIDPRIRIGHLHEAVRYYDEMLRLQSCSAPEWRRRFQAAPITKPATAERMSV